jgi:transposase
MRYTYQQFLSDCPTDAACLDKVMEMRHGATPTCPSCGRVSKFHRIAKRRGYACQHCGHHVFPCVGTPFEKSSTPLQKWFYAMYLFTSTRHGVPAKELERQLGVTYKTAWRMAHELRKMMAAEGSGGPLSGHVEADESYLGGKRSGGKRGRGAPGKTVVFGMLERGGEVRAEVVPDVKRKTLEPIIVGNVAEGSTVSTDELASYGRLAERGYEHGLVRHRTGEYVSGVHHVNGVEGFWSRLKRCIRGTHVHVSGKHLDKYVAEFAFRHNMRKEPSAMFARLLAAL